MTARTTLFISLALAAVFETRGQVREEIRSFRFRDVDLASALDSLLRWYAVPLIYLDKDVSGKLVNAECSECDFQGAFKEVLKGQALRWKRIEGQVVLQADEKALMATIAGTIRDSLTAEAVAGADVLLLSPEETPYWPAGLSGGRAVKVYRWCSANQFGFFSLRNIRPGDYVLVIRRLGYQPVHELVRIHPSSALVRDFLVREHELTYREITVEGRRSGFSALEGISRGTYIRATPTDHNQYFLEGARIYNPLHFGGVMSTFNDNALREYHVIAGGVPPYYGGRIGGILDVALREGSEHAMNGSATLGSVESDFSLEGPVASGSTFLLSGRLGYPDIFFPGERLGLERSNLRSTEVMGKLTHRVSDNQHLSLSTYFGRDSYGKSVLDPTGTSLSNAFRWGNAAINLRWSGISSPALFFHTSAIYTRYGFGADHSIGTGSSLGPQTYLSSYSLEDVSIRAHAEYYYDEHHTVLAGTELVRHRMAGKVSEFSSQMAPMSFDGFSPWELSVYFQDQWRLVPSVLAELGARATSFVAEQGSFSAVDPRFSLLISPSEGLHFYSSFSAVTQFIHPYRNSGIFLFYPSIFLYSSAENIRPTTSLQISAGAEAMLKEDRFKVSLESYYRTMKNLHEFAFDTTVSGTLANRLLHGEGDVYGIEFIIQKRLGDLRGSVRYGLSWASNRFAELNNGQPFRPRFDRRHELFATVSYAISEYWALGISCQISANDFLSLDVDRSAAPTSPESAGFADLLSRSGYGEPYDLNGGRLPGFQRLELRVVRAFSLGGISTHAGLRMLNGYGLVDPFVWRLEQNSDVRKIWSVRIDAPSLFPLYPVVYLGMRF